MKRRRILVLTQLSVLQSVRKGMPPSVIIFRDKRRQTKHKKPLDS